MITLLCVGHSYAYEMEHVVRMFFPGVRVRTLKGAPVDAKPDAEPCIRTAVERKNGLAGLHVRVKLARPLFDGARSEDIPANSPGAEQERVLGILLYRLLSEATGIEPPWGILTGVRPVRLCRRWMEEGLAESEVLIRMREAYLVSAQKAELALATAAAQRHILSHNKIRDYSLYVSIPFCPTRCLYCSFVSQAVSQAAKLIPDYVRLLCEELVHTAALARRLGLVLRTIYIGGGTPTVLTPELLKQLLAAVKMHFELSGLAEHTVEAGRPDTVTTEKLALLREFGVDRVSVNPQSMDDGVLRAIGRAHTAAQVEEAMGLVRDAGFKAVNMDLIAGLPGETARSFAHTLDAVLRLRPENITLHTLTVKRSSRLRERPDAFAGSSLDLNEQLVEAQTRLLRAGYAPYYLYRQKGTVQNLENTGFSLPGKEGRYNIYSMEEVHTVLAAGAGAITKLCGRGRIRRVCNFKYPFEYIDRFTEILDRKGEVEELYDRAE